MTTAEAMPETQKIATYYVVPVTPDIGIESVLYYEGPLKSKWKSVSKKDLNAHNQGCNAGLVKLIQPSEDQILASTDLSPAQLDRTASLYCGVAKTLGEPDQLKSYYAIDADGSLTINVSKDTTRGLILIFTQTDPLNGDSTRYPVRQLIATTDPEIKNSAIGTGGH
ncbi:hypothetical protein [Duganella radicis]|uniref:Uncharacterized protein n=1 Tax=Duganella radicis TaxID=551988 RepID=A0A6L6PB78_9BURK|nr:hypothetical protein [Duganella radicis]MTV36308.1 hypothetical protein [Duganella radicis]